MGYSFFKDGALFQYQNTVKIDKKDRKLLALISNNARTPLTQLAKQIGLSKDGVRYRLERLERSGIVLGYTTIVNHASLGKKWFGVLFNPYFHNQEEENKFYELLKKIPEVLKVMRMNGRWNYQMDVVVDKPEHMAEIINELKKITIFNELTVYHHFKERIYMHLPPNFFKENKIKFPPAGRFDPDVSLTTLDQLDETLLKELAANGRETLVNLSLKCGCSVDTIHYRMRRLEKTGVIKGYTAVINTALLTDEYWLFIKTKGSINQLRSLLQDMSTVGSLVDIGFHRSFLVWSLAASISKLEEELYWLKERASGIEAIEVLTALREMKYTEYPGVDIKLID